MTYCFNSDRVNRRPSSGTAAGEEGYRIAGVGMTRDDSMEKRIRICRNLPFCEDCMIVHLDLRFEISSIPVALVVCAASADVRVCTGVYVYGCCFYTCVWLINLLPSSFSPAASASESLASLIVPFRIL